VEIAPGRRVFPVLERAIGKRYQSLQVDEMFKREKEIR